MPQSESFNTPTKAGGRIVDRDAAPVRAHARVNGNAIRDEAFYDKYLQPLGDDALPTARAWEKFKRKVFNDFKKRNESTIYVPLASLLNEISCIVHRKVYASEKRKESKGKATNQENTETCIPFRDTSDQAPKGVENMKIRPDLTATKADYQTTKKCVSLPTYGVTNVLYWYKIATFVEAKEEATEEDNDQLRGYASRMCEAHPDPAGILYLVISKERCRICWSNASRAVQGPSFSWFVDGKDEFDDAALQYLFRLVKTLHTPLPAFTQIEPTIIFANCDDDDDPSWAFKLKSKVEELIGTRLSSSPAYSRQTFVLRARKDDDETLSNTGTDAEMDSETESPVTQSDVTTPATAGAGSRPEDEDDEAKYNYVIKDHWRDGSRQLRETGLYAKANGVPGMAQMYHAERGFDVVQTHQTLVNKKGFLHRDLSPNNILLNMRHNEDCEFDDYPDEKYIHEVLNGPPKEGEKKVIKGGTIDFDNGADMNNDSDCIGTERTGTRKFIANPVTKGKCQRFSARDPKIRFPTLNGEPLRLYIEAYSEEKYRHYIEQFEKSVLFLDGEGSIFRQLPVHDAESIIWIIVDHLLRAFPDGRCPEVNNAAVGALKAFINHDIEKFGDSRSGFQILTKGEWVELLHPKLSHMAHMLVNLCELISLDWTLWCMHGHLPMDFLHEGIKRIILQEIVHIKVEKCDVLLSQEDRKPMFRTTIHASPGKEESNSGVRRKSESMFASSSKRSRFDTDRD